jgi:hypothetical protein
MSLSSKPLRTMFFISINQNFHDLALPEASRVVQAFIAALDDLKGRFGIDVLGTMDDDQMMVGASEGWPWTAYILADVPNLDAVVAVCNLFREVSAGDGQLWKYARIQARVGRILMAGNR